jgi:TSC-22/dip/bun family
VKDHLLFAVREEVRQLRLQLSQLAERHDQLAVENLILRASVPPQTLAVVDASLGARWTSIVANRASIK